MSADISPLVLLIVTVVPSVSIVLIFLLGHPMGQKNESQKKKTCQTGKKKKKNIKGDQTRDASKENSGKKTEELQSYRTKELKALEEILCDEIPKMKSDFAMDLAYMLGVGQDFEMWLCFQEENNPSPKDKTSQILRMWESHYGATATPVKIVASLKKMPRTENIISAIMAHWA